MECTEYGVLSGSPGRADLKPLGMRARLDEGHRDTAGIQSTSRNQ